MATIGRNKAVADLKNFKTAGFFAWMMWLFVHLVSLIGFRNKVVVVLNWFWNYITYDQSLRVIIGGKDKQE
jgi:NADH dehydrogenase